VCGARSSFVGTHAARRPARSSARGPLARSARKFAVLLRAQLCPAGNSARFTQRGVSRGLALELDLHAPEGSQSIGRAMGKFDCPLLFKFGPLNRPLFAATPNGSSQRNPITAAHNQPPAISRHSSGPVERAPEVSRWVNFPISIRAPQPPSNGILLAELSGRLALARSSCLLADESRGRADATRRTRLTFKPAVRLADSSKFQFQVASARHVPPFGRFFVFETQRQTQGGRGRQYKCQTPADLIKMGQQVALPRQNSPLPRGSLEN